jgi:uncharacterized integral membrane protein (TIGR00698 family)
MQPPRWIPRRSDGAGLALVAALGIGSLLAVRALPRSPLISDVLLAMLAGAAVLNTPLGGRIGLTMQSCADASDRYAKGVAFACSWLLRLAIILMGLKVETSVIGGSALLLVLGVCVISIPSTFMVTQILGARLGLRRPLTDLLASGSMICGASAVNATAPIVGAQRQEQGLAVGVVFLSSVAAMLTFRAIAHAVGLSSGDAGLWSGLAVNDLSSAVAVGSQMGGTGGVLAAAAKSTRILMLAPVLVSFALLRKGGSGQRKEMDADLRRSIMASLPRFILGYLALALVRAGGDRVFGAAPAWHQLLATNHVVVEVLMVMVSAGIGLNLAFRTILSSSSRAVVTSMGASAFMAACTLALITAASRGALGLAVFIGSGTLAVAYLAYRATTAREVRESDAAPLPEAPPQRAP